MDDGPTTPVDRCTAHEGAHALYLGHCYAFGAQVKRPTRWHGRPVYCQECGAAQDVLRLPNGRVVLLTAGTEDRHVHPSDQASERMAAVATGLEALQETLAAMLAERQQARAPRPPEAQPPSSRAPDPPPRRVIE